MPREFKIREGKTTLTIESDWWRDETLTLTKKSQNGMRELDVKLITDTPRNGAGTDRKDSNRVWNRVTISWEAAERIAEFVNGGPRQTYSKFSNTDRNKNTMRQVSMAASQLRSGFKRLELVLAEAKLEAQVEKNNTYPTKNHKDQF